LNDLLPDEEEAGIASVAKPGAFIVIIDDNCRSCSRRETKASPRQSLINSETIGWERGSLLISHQASGAEIANRTVFAKKRDKDGK